MKRALNALSNFMFMAKYANTREKEQNYEDHSTTRHSTKNVIEKVNGLDGFCHA